MMEIEPWSLGRGMHIAPSASPLVSIGPLVSGIYVERVEMTAVTQAVVTVDLQMTRGPSRARSFGDMLGETPLFVGAVASMSGGLVGVRCRTSSTNTWNSVYAWGFEVLTGQEWINIAVDNTTAAFTYLYFSAFGFRRMKPDEDP